MFYLQYADYQNNVPETLWMMNADGSDRKEVFSLPFNETIVNAVAADKDELYITVMVTENAKENPIKEIRRVGYKSGLSSVVTTIGTTDWVFGAFGDSLAILYYEDDEYTLKSLSVDTGESKDFYSFKVSSEGMYDQGPICEFCKDTLFVITPEGDNCASVTKIDAGTMSSETITHDLPFYFRSSTYIKGFFGDYMVVDVTDNREAENIIEQRFAVNTMTGEIIELTNRIDHLDMTEFIPIVDYAGDSFLVISSYNQVEFTIYGTDGTPYTAYADNPVYSFISESEFLANNLDYINVNDTTVNN